MAVFAMKDEAEASRGAGCCSLDKEKRKHPHKFDGHKLIRRRYRIGTIFTSYLGGNRPCRKKY